jgi:GINS complex subunit 2
MLTVPSTLSAAAGPSSGETGWSAAGSAGTALTHEELEFVAEEELVSIVPSFSAGRLNLLAGDVGPFRAQIPVSVPLWAAIALRAKGKAAILPPDWMDVARLEEVLKAERSAEGYQELPFHYIELATVLLKHAGDAFGERRQKVQDLFETIRSVRFAKLERGLRTLDGTQLAIKLTNVCAMELNVLRPFTLTALNRMAHNAGVEAEAGRGAARATAERAQGARGGEEAAPQARRVLRRG